MSSANSLKEILLQGQSHWDRSGTRPEARQAFRKALSCRTAALGAEIYASDTTRKVVFHTCKSRACASCGNWATQRWQRERFCALPSLACKGITFTMPDGLWPFFKHNPALLSALPALASDAIAGYARVRHGTRVGVMAVPHTFNPKLEFNAHVHAMVTSGGLQTASASWSACFYFDQDALMRRWRRGVILLLRTALRSGTLKTALRVEDVESLLEEKEACWWSVKIQSFRDTDHFLRYAGRYVRRPPIAQWRIKQIKDGEVEFLHKNKRSASLETASCSIEEFIDRWSQHIPQRCSHVIRHFGLFSPRSSAHTSRAVFAILGQTPKSCSRISFAFSIRRNFGRDPLLDATGHRLKWVGRFAPVG